MRAQTLLLVPLIASVFIGGVQCQKTSMLACQLMGCYNKPFPRPPGCAMFCDRPPVNRWRSWYSKEQSGSFGSGLPWDEQAGIRPPWFPMRPMRPMRPPWFPMRPLGIPAI